MCLRSVFENNNEKLLFLNCFILSSKTRTKVEKLRTELKNMYKKIKNNFLSVLFFI